MSTVTMETAAAQTAAYGGFVDAIGGIAVCVLAIIGLTGFDPEGMGGIATIVLGAALLVQGGAILSEFAHILNQPYQQSAATAAGEFTGGDGLAATFIVGAAGVVLGVLALLGIASMALTAIAVIAYGSALVLSSGSVRQLSMLRGETLFASRTGRDVLVGQMASGSAGMQLLTGLAAVVLGILAVAGHAPGVLTLTALLVLGVTVLFSGSALSTLVLSFMRPGRERNVSRRPVA